MRFVCPALLLEKVSCCSNPIACGDDTDAPKKKKYFFLQTWFYNNSTKGKHNFDSIFSFKQCVFQVSVWVSMVLKLSNWNKLQISQKFELEYYGVIKYLVLSI